MTKELIELGLQLKQIIGRNDLEDGYYTLPENIKLHVSSWSWEDEGKYQCGDIHANVIVDGEPTELYLIQSASRSGSYYSDYEYSYEKVELAEKKTEVVTVTKYVPLKVGK